MNPPNAYPENMSHLYINSSDERHLIRRVGRIVLDKHSNAENFARILSFYLRKRALSSPIEDVEAINFNGIGPTI